jgi:hypothetical protein
MAVTSSLAWYRRFCNAWKWAGHAPNPSMCSQMAWSSTTSKQSRSTYKKSSHCTEGIGMQDYPSSSFLTGHPLTTLWAYLWLA